MNVPTVNVSLKNVKLGGKSAQKQSNSRPTEHKGQGGKLFHRPPTYPVSKNQPPQPSTPEPTTSPTSFLWSWQLWGVMVIIVTGTIGFSATALLTKSPAMPNCPSMFWPTASASMRLYCAELAANKQTIEDLLEAIRLVEDLPLDHPLRGEIDRNIEKWVNDLLALGEQEFQEGRLQEAIALANKVSQYLQDPSIVQERIERWNEVWQQGEQIAEEAESHIKNAAWGLAFQNAARLTRLNNRYWANTRYRELFDYLELARRESRQLDEAYTALNRGGLDNLLQAIELAQNINDRSSAYAEAQMLISRAGDKMIDLALELLQEGKWQEAMRVSNQIPSELGLTEQALDINMLAEAASTASYGTVRNLEDAIARAIRVTPGRPLYRQAQKLARQWQLEAEAVVQLDQADQLARDGRPSSLNAAIAQARLVTRENPRYSQAQSRISDWTRQIQTLEDRPRLERAQNFARQPGLDSLEQAVEEARQIDPNRPLYREAQMRIQQWENNIQQTEDQPILDEAMNLATQGNFRAAIQTAQRIQRDRALYNEAQSRISRWEREVNAQRLLAQAQQLAQRGTPEALNQAINRASQVPNESLYRYQSNQAVQVWSEQILAMARNRAGSDLRTAIAIASQVPPNTPAYNAARSQLEIWQRILNPSQSAPANDYLDVQDWGNL
ncbi:hypothetical protein K4A83_11025 [Spirulina subsalsa FACHB-351]|uniref:Chromosome segregation ATPase n=1 Tax=Spirulina subsalsa FACHB-351 TaxID=234711 RepID=A0ABT3L5K6_9CYAN|nr:hypothetical protein [Spirulina subsalsa]MCW6036791.1 hypothetical protein [Spirulina subsalsa FACHB-351]